MIENSKPRLEDLPEGEELPTEDEKVHFPVAGIIIIASLVVLAIACAIVILVVNGGHVPQTTSQI